MSPILVRPVREQLEHDRVIRLLQQDLQKRKVEVGINPGAEQNASVGAGSRKEYPDAVVYSLEKGKKVVAVVEVETGESVNHLEAMAQWAHLAKLRVPFHLYVPMHSVDVARRLSHDYNISVTEIWSYHQVGEQFKFTLIHPPGSRGGKGAGTAPRTVSVASIRVAVPAEIETPAIEEPGEVPAPPPVASKPAAGKAVAAREAPVVAKAPRVVPVKASKPALPKAVAAAPPPSKSFAKGSTPTPASKPPIVVKSTAPPPKTVAKPPTKASPKVPALTAKSGRPAAKNNGRSAAAKPVKSRAAVKPPARPVAKAAKTGRKPARVVTKSAGKRK